MAGILWSEHFTMEDNPNLTKEFVAAQKKLYKGFFFKRFIEGLWVLAEGAIYKDFCQGTPLRPEGRAGGASLARLLPAADHRR